MKSFALALISVLVLTCSLPAQQKTADVPATREDVQRYLDAMHSRQMIRQMLDGMSEPMHKMAHDQCEQNKQTAPPDCEARLTKLMDGMFKDVPIDEMLDAMIPAYQKHFTKADFDALIAFYTSPAGQKILRELPQVSTEAMTAMMPIMQKHLEKIGERVQAEVAATVKTPQGDPTPSK